MLINGGTSVERKNSYHSSNIASVYYIKFSVYDLGIGMSVFCFWGGISFQASDGIETLGQDKEELQSSLSDHLEISSMCGTYWLILNILCSNIKAKLFFKILPGVSSVSENNFWLMHAKVHVKCSYVNLALWWSHYFCLILLAPAQEFH